MRSNKRKEEKIKKKRADYVLALKKNQSCMYEEVREYFSDEEFLKVIQNEGNYRKTQEKAHGQIEIHEYYQTEDIKWLKQKKNWKGLKSIVMEKKRFVISLRPIQFLEELLEV